MKSGAITISANERGLLVWGRIDQGRVILEPAFDVDAPASLPRGGSHKLEGFGAAGESLFSMRTLPAIVSPTRLTAMTRPSRS
jgi:hypothetical protein